MNFRRLEYFLTVAETGSLRQASEILRISPPALSKAMRLLESELETKIWINDGRRLILTDAGKALLKKAPLLIENFKALKSDLLTGSVGPKPIRIGTFEVFSTYFLTFLDTLAWDNHSLELHELLPGEVEKYIEQGDLDIGITYMPVPNPNLDFLKVKAIEMGVYTKKGRFEGVTQDQLPFVIPVAPLQGTPTKMKGLDGWPEDAFNRKVLHRVTLLESALELCRQGRVAGYFPSFVVCEHNKRVSPEYRLERRRAGAQLTGCKLREADVFIVKRKSYEETDVIKQIARAIRQIC
ncbi:MAG: LysR family transcriptional regulator [Bdellovibrionaceae bacterium]|nr:LysR family transcriptional regulator [Pseudobdellovibrionaceae bacterium]